MQNKKVIGRECRFAVYCQPPQGHNTDLHVIKEIVHYEDGTSEPNVRLAENFKRPFYVTQKGYRNHRDKKEWESLDKVKKFESTQSQLLNNVARAVDEPWFRGNMRKLQRNPFIYGTDILSTAIIKKSYQDKYPNLITPFTKAVFDIESDVVKGTDEIIMATLSFGSKIITAVQKSFVEGQSNVISRLRDKMNHYLGKFIEQRKIDWEIVVVDREVDVIKACFKRAHEWKPDFVAIWNINYDIPEVLKALQRCGVDPKNIFSDPSVPREFKFFNYVEGQSQKVTASGLITPIPFAARWHTVYCPSSFYFVDAMCVYRHVRTGNQLEQSYALDAILDKEFKDQPEIRKLKFEEAEGLEGLDWHVFMQEKFPLEYIIYNVFDCISVELLDEKTQDMSLVMPLFSGCSDFYNFKSQPRRLADALHYFCLDNGYVIGSTSDQMSNELDQETLGLEGWITTLPAHLVHDNGLRVILEDRHLKTNIRAQVADLDVAASYPNGGAVFNISKETTHKELCSIMGIPEAMQRIQGLNLSGGHTNAVEICTELYSLPPMEKMLAAFEKKIAVPELEIA